jgi:outer membrane beta-barrel protein
MKTKTRKLTTRLLAATLMGFAALAVTERADAQEILLTGPLAGAPAVRKLRLHRQGRFEFSPGMTFTLLDEYQRTFFVGAKLGYNFTDWLQIGAWGGYGKLIQISTYLTDQIQEQNAIRVKRATDEDARDTERRLTAVNLGPNFEDQLGSMDWIVAPQVTWIPFRGKLALFQSIYLDTDFYVFGGPAFIGLTERADCTDCASDNVHPFLMASRTAIAPTFGLGFSFYINHWSAVGVDWRFLPFSYNSGGFDTAGGGKDAEFPDNKITDADRRFHFQQMLSVSFNVNLPTAVRLSE